MKRSNWRECLFLTAIFGIGISANATALSAASIHSDLQPAPKPSTNELLRKSYQQMLEGQYNAAITTEIKTIKVDKDNLIARRYLVYSLLQSGAPEAAIEQLKLIGRLSKPTGIDLCLYGEAALLSHDYLLALNYFKDAQIIDQNLDAAKFGLIKALTGHGDYSEALKYCRQGFRETSNPQLQARYRTLSEQVRDIVYNPEKQGDLKTDAATIFGEQSKKDTATANSAPQENTASETKQTDASATTSTEGKAQPAAVNAGRLPAGNNESINPWAGFKGLQKTMPATNKQKSPKYFLQH